MSPLQIGGIMAAALVLVVVGGVLFMVWRNRTARTPEVMYQNTMAASDSRRSYAEARHIVAPVPKKASPPFLEQDLERVPAVPEIMINPPSQ